LILRKIIKIYCHEMSDFKAKMHQIRFRLRLCPRPRWGSLQHSPNPLAGIKWAASQQGGGRERDGKGREDEGREGRQREWRREGERENGWGWDRAWDGEGKGKGGRGGKGKRGATAPQTLIPGAATAGGAFDAWLTTSWGKANTHCGPARV